MCARPRIARGHSLVESFSSRFLLRPLAAQAEDIEHIFIDVGRAKNDMITSADFVELFSEFIVGDVGMHEIVKASISMQRKPQ